jgi:hypothetical protein
MLSGFTHYRRLTNESLGLENAISLEWRPEIDILLTFLHANLACIDFDGVHIHENLDKGERWINTRTIAFNKHVVVTYSEMEEYEFARQQAAFTANRPPPPFAFSFSEYVDNDLARKNDILNIFSNIDINFNENNIFDYISSFTFTYIGYQSIQSWMLEMISGDYNTLYPSYLVAGNGWYMERMKEVYDFWIAEDSDSDINKIFHAFELYTLNCILEVI